MRGLGAVMMVLASAGCGSTRSAPPPVPVNPPAPLVVATADAAISDDTDRDLIPDRCDACPAEPETYNGDTDLDGCPDRDVLYIAQPFGPFGIPFKPGTTVPERDAAPVLDAIVGALQNRWETGVEIVACADASERPELIAARQQWLRAQLIARGAVERFLLVVPPACTGDVSSDTHRRWVRAQPHAVTPAAGCPDRTAVRVVAPTKPAPVEDVAAPTPERKPDDDRVTRPSAGKCKPGLCMLDTNKCVKVGYHSGVGGTGPCSSCENGRCIGSRCAAPTTQIDTPTGPRAIAELRAGDLVWSTDENGQRVVAALARVSSTPVSEHHVVRIVLDDGAELLLSPGHPTATGTRVGDLHEGDALPPRHVVSIEVVPYPFGATYDILPATVSGTYFSDGVALGSTLARARN